MIAGRGRSKKNPGKYDAASVHPRQPRHKPLLEIAMGGRPRAEGGDHDRGRLYPGSAMAAAGEAPGGRCYGDEIGGRARKTVWTSGHVAR